MIRSACETLTNCTYACFMMFLWRPFTKLKNTSYSLAIWHGIRLFGEGKTWIFPISYWISNARIIEYQFIQIYNTNCSRSARESFSSFFESLYNANHIELSSNVSLCSFHTFRNFYLIQAFKSRIVIMVFLWYIFFLLHSMHCLCKLMGSETSIGFISSTMDSKHWTIREDPNLKTKNRKTTHLWFQFIE